MTNHNEMDLGSLMKATDGGRIVGAIASGNVERLQEVINGMTPDELQQAYVDINKQNANRADLGLPPVTVVLNDQDHDGRIDVSGTNTGTGLTIAAEGERQFAGRIGEGVFNAIPNDKPKHAKGGVYTSEPGADLR